ncbi:hypothetical protein H9X57_07605 [Flavobacterium piscinae]|nr:hypothetical protein [Flavobacterium piscinae]MBC8883344.1 hypothetical protein [Flavobacterium piscinae]
MHEIIKGVTNQNEISEKENFLLILGFEDDFCWKGFVYKEKEWREL